MITKEPKITFPLQPTVKGQGNPVLTNEKKEARRLFKLLKIKQKPMGLTYDDLTDYGIEIILRYYPFLRGEK